MSSEKIAALNKVESLVRQYPVALHQDWIVITVPEKGNFSAMFEQIESKIDPILPDLAESDLLFISVRRSNQIRDIPIKKSG